jgi:serine-type D-Ala-D-Ala carboxypeptidase/endopeptidase (penicillin-binding protein 4)
MHTADIADLVGKLQAAGVTKVAGRVIADDGYFDGKRSVPGWRPVMTAYCGPLSALTLNEGFGPNGAYVGDPSLWAASKLTTLLRAAGIKVTHAAARGTAPADAVVAASVASAPLSRLLAAMDKPSDNFLAEELLKDLGASFGGAGTTLAGTQVAKQFLTAVGVPSGGFRIHDGSGLSYSDKLSADAVLTLLTAMAKRPDFLTFRASLAVAGVDGTLEDRMEGTAAAGNVHAKTGSLAAASCLSGYVTSANGHELAFSLLMNGSGLSEYEAHAAQDAVAVVLARSSP